MIKEYTKKDLLIVMGTLDRTNKTENTFVRATEDWVIHPSYDPDDMPNDVAVIKVMFFFSSFD